MAEARPSTADALRGLGVAGALLGTWALSTAGLLGAAPVQPAPWVVGAVLVQTFLFTGLFITAHDGMHGTICPRYPRLNHAVGALAVALYAAFDYRALRAAHKHHHATPATPGQDPDFHDGQHPQLVRWYLTFMGRYLRVWQVVVMAVVFNVLQHLGGVPVENLLLFWVVPALLSTVQLFVVGTWLPHRGPPEGPHRARTLALPVGLSLLACYHFGYHLEHHERPGVPWWRLPQARAKRAR